MIIKKFTGKTQEEALEAARKELGDGIVTMNVKSVKKKGFAGLFGSKQTEVTVALEEESENLKGNRKEPAASASGSAGAGTRTAAALDKPRDNMIEKKLDSLETLLVKSLKQEDAVRTEQLSKAEEASTADSEEIPEEPEEQVLSKQEKFIRLLYNTMLENEVDEKYANQIIGDVDKSGKPDLPIDYILANVYQKMILKFNKPTGIEESQKGPKVVLFMGPTGVGKTTTIAKVASSYVVDYKKKVALLTADTYRIAAAEQLRTYANILGVPFQVVYSPEEAAAAVRNFRDFEYILIDTAGHSHQNKDQMNEMKKLLEAVGAEAEYQTFLVLSATTKYRDLLKIAENYREITQYQLVFTKLDETASLGNLLNVKLYTGTEIAFVTFGQNVPDDIEVFNPQKAVRQLLSTRH